MHSYHRDGKTMDTRHLISKTVAIYNDLEKNIANAKVRNVLKLLVGLIKLMVIIDQCVALSANLHIIENDYYNIKNHLF